MMYKDETIRIGTYDIYGTSILESFDTLEMIKNANDKI